MPDLLDLDEFKSYIERGEIPPMPPVTTSRLGFDYTPCLPTIESYLARQFCTEHGMWAIVDQRWTRALAKWCRQSRWIRGHGTMLEVMAGHGWLAKALAMHGVDIIATDSMSEHFRQKHKLGKPVCDVEELEASKAVLKYGGQADILLVSWPPYQGKDIFEAVKLWDGKPIIYIGESEGGCTGCPELYQVFVQDETVPEIPLFAWAGIHDEVMIGHIDMSRYDPEKLEDQA